MFCVETRGRAFFHAHNYSTSEWQQLKVVQKILVHEWLKRVVASEWTKKSIASFWDLAWIWHQHFIMNVYRQTNKMHIFRLPRPKRGRRHPSFHDLSLRFLSLCVCIKIFHTKYCENNHTSAISYIFLFGFHKASNAFIESFSCFWGFFLPVCVCPLSPQFTLHSNSVAKEY